MLFFKLCPFQAGEGSGEPPGLTLFRLFKASPCPSALLPLPGAGCLASQLLGSHRGGRHKAGPPPPQGSDSPTMAQCQPYHPHGRAALCQQTQKQGGDGDVPRLSVTLVMGSGDPFSTLAGPQQHQIQTHPRAPECCSGVSPGPVSSQGGTCWEFKLNNKPSRSHLSSPSYCKSPACSCLPEGDLDPRGWRTKRGPRREIFVSRKGSFSPPLAGAQAERKPTSKDEQKITEGGWSESSRFRQEFHRLTKKEALVFLFGQKKTTKPPHHQPYLLPAAMQSSTFLWLNRGPEAPRRGGTHSRKG